MREKEIKPGPGVNREVRHPIRPPSSPSPSPIAVRARLQARAGNRALATALHDRVRPRAGAAAVQRFTNLDVQTRAATLHGDNLANWGEAKVLVRAAELHALKGGGPQSPAAANDDYFRAQREVAMAWEFHQLAHAGKMISPDMATAMQAGLTTEEYIAVTPLIGAGGTQHHRRHDYALGANTLNPVDIAATQAQLDGRDAANPLRQVLTAGNASLPVSQMAQLKAAFFNLVVPTGPALTGNQKTQLFGTYSLPAGLHEVTMRQPDGRQLTFWAAVVPHGTTAPLVLATARAASQATLGNVSASVNVDDVTTQPFRTNHAVAPHSMNDAAALMSSFDRHRANTKIRWDAATHAKILLEVKSRTLAHGYTAGANYRTRDTYPMIDVDPVALEIVTFDAKFEYGVLHNGTTGAWMIYHFNGSFDQGNRRVLNASPAVKVGLRNLLTL